MLVAFNLSPHSTEWTLPLEAPLRVLDGHGLSSGHVDDGRLSVPARGVFYALLD